MKNITVYIEHGEGFHFPSTEYRFTLLNHLLFIKSRRTDLGDPFYYVLDLKGDTISSIIGEPDEGVWKLIGTISYIGGD